jgi:hypothetical protein
LLTASHGLNAACIAMLAQRVAMMPIPLIVLRRLTGISLIEIIWGQLPLLGAAATMGLVVVWSAPLITELFGHLLTLPILVAIGAVIYLPLALLAAPDVIKDLYDRAYQAINPNIGTV